MLTFHVGYPKSGSTTLQQNLFSRHSGIVNLGLFPTANVGNFSRANNARRHESSNEPYLKDGRIRRLYSELVQADGLVFNLGKARALWQEIQSDYCIDTGKTNVLSHEGVTSSRFSNPEVVEKARRVRDIFGEAKILIVTRAQQDMLRSLYRDHPFDPRTLEYRPRPVSFSEWLKIDLTRKHCSLSNSLLFDRMAECYENLFGRNNVLVLPLELLRLDRNRFCQILAHFLNIDFEETVNALSRSVENTGVSASGNTYRRIRNRLYPALRWLRPLNTALKPLDDRIFSLVKRIGRTEEINLKESDMVRLRQFYAEDNQRLERRVRLNCAELGYLVSGG